MTALVKLHGVAQLFHAVEIVIPAEEVFELKIHIVADALGATRNNRMHQQRCDTQQIERINQYLAASIGILIGLRFANAA